MTNENNSHHKHHGMRRIFVGEAGGLDPKFNDQERKKKAFPKNKISTTKYSLLSFLPKALLYQFLRFANVYFLITAIIQSISIISPLHPFSAIAPFIFVLTVSLIREGVEDFGRYKTDKEVNAGEAMVFKNNQWVKTKWADIEVGDFIRNVTDDKFPCDMVLLSCNRKKDARGTVYIETASLDGEKNLKPRIAISEIMDLLDSQGSEEQLLGRFRAKINCREPDPDLHHFDGVIKIDEQEFALSPKQLLLRGASMKNTVYSIGVAVYTGPHTKVMKNSENSRYKISRIEDLMNSLIFKLLILQALMYFGSMVGFLAWNIENKDLVVDFLPRSGFSLPIDTILMIFTYFVIYNTLLPISLIVSIDIVKMVQAYFIGADQTFYSEKLKLGCRVMTSSINEELGQVEYVFSDKTGTLTCNIMELKYIGIGNVIYEGVLEIVTNEHNKYAKQGGYYSKELQMNQKNTSQLERSIDLRSQDGATSIKISTPRDLIDLYFTLLATCHECVVETKGENSSIIEYEGPSPDEICLVSAARQHHYVHLGSTSNTTIVHMAEGTKEFELVTLFSFDNKRKMMSALIKHEGVFKLLVKGADSAIISRLNTSIEQPFEKMIQQKLQDYSREGLRTLCMGVKILSPNEVQNIVNESLVINKSANKKELLEKFLDKIERDFFLVGCSAVEDKLQDQVPETIADLLRANIKVWMLTGDKMETAENIGLSCNLIDKEFELLRLMQNNEQEAQNYLGTYQDKMNLARSKKKRVCTVIDGICLGVILKDKERAIQYLNIMKDCESVICCRVTPMQKADVVRLVKKNLGKTSLAIGDGANDVNMIQEGDIGVGIFGLEGRQAANASDFAVPEFKALHRLLFLHGRWSYVRNSELILYFFYKNMIFTIPQLFYIFLNAYSGITLFDDWYMTFYNLFFTSIPLVIKAILDQDIHFAKFQKNEQGKLVYKENQTIKKLQPYIYRVGQENTLFNNKNFLSWIFKGIIQGFFIWLVAVLSLNDGTVNKEGHISDFWYVSITMFTGIFLVVTLKMIYMIKFWTWLNFISLTILSIAPYFAWVFIADKLPTLKLSFTVQMIFSTWHFYLIVFLTVGTFAVYEVGIFLMKNIFFVEYDVLIKSLDNMGKLKSMPQEEIIKIFKRRGQQSNQVSQASQNEASVMSDNMTSKNISFKK